LQKLPVYPPKLRWLADKLGPQPANALTLLGLSFLMVGMLACKPNQEKQGGKLRIACTTGMIADALANLAGDSAEVTALMGPGVDPHLYKATHGDLKKLTKADLIFYNGLHLEGKMAGLLQKLGRRKPVIPFGEGLPVARLITTDGAKQVHDPHIWFDVALWREAVAVASVALQQHGRRNQVAYFQANTQKYLAELDSLEAHTRHTLAAVPPGRRILVTSHDAFGYFGRAYQFEVRGLQGFSTLTDFGLRDINQLVDFIVQYKLKAIFIESSVPAKSIEAVVEGCQAKGHPVIIGGPLFSDAMGAAGTPEGTYVGMVQANARLIATALR